VQDGLDLPLAQRLLDQRAVANAAVDQRGPFGHGALVAGGQ
jgi:hypothetical protein